MVEGLFKYISGMLFHEDEKQKTVFGFKNFSNKNIEKSTIFHVAFEPIIPCFDRYLKTIWQFFHYAVKSTY